MGITLLVTGTRDLGYGEAFWSPRCKYEDAERLAMKAVAERLDALAAELKAEGTPVTHLVCGGAAGPDRWAAAWAVRNSMEPEVIRPKWMRPDGTMNRSAGFSRNWYMAYRTAGRAVANACGKTGQRPAKLKRLQALVKQYAPLAARGLCKEGFADLVAYREAMTDWQHPARHSVSRRLHIPLPDHQLVVAFWDGKSAGTKHQLGVCRSMGYLTRVYEYPRAEMAPRPQDRDKGRIDHRPDAPDQMSFASFTEVGWGG